MPDRTRSNDERLLTMLHLRDHEGLSANRIAERFRISKGSVVGALYRIDLEANRHSSNQDGTLKPMWWRS